MKQSAIDNSMNTYLNTLRNYVSPECFLTASLLSDGVVQKMKRQNETTDSLYAALLQYADEIGLQNPFLDKGGFYEFYEFVKNRDPINWEMLLQQTMRASRSATILPEPLIKLMIKDFKRNPKTVLIAEAEKFILLLTQMVENHPESKFYLTTQNQSYKHVLTRIFMGYTNVEIGLTDIYHYEFINSHFDLILSTPIFGNRDLIEDSRFISKETDFVALENLSLHLSNSGLLEIVLPARITFASGKANDLRNFIQSNYTIREISELPEGTFRNTGIKTFLLKLENIRPNGDEDIDIKRYSAGKRKNRREVISSLAIEDETLAMLPELEEQSNWNVDRIFAKQDEDYIAFEKSTIRKEVLSNVAEIFRGKAIRDKDQDGNIGVINISNIGEYEIDYESLEKVSLNERKTATYILKEGDVLLPARGTTIRTAVFRKQSYPCIASSNLIIIRPNSELLNSIYLKIFIDSPIGNKLILSSQQGLLGMNISYKDLGVLEVPLPPISHQNEIAKTYLAELELYRKSVQEAKRRWETILQKVQQF